MHPDINVIGLAWLAEGRMRMVVDGSNVGDIATSSDLSKKITEHTGIIGTAPYNSKNFNDYGNYLGIWSCGDPTNCVNCPAPTSIGVLVSFGGSAYSAQLYITISHLYYRMYTPSGSWQPWNTI